MPNLIMASAFSMLFYMLFSNVGPVNQLLTQAGFLDVTVRRDGPQADAGRIFLTAMRSLEYGV